MGSPNLNKIANMNLKMPTQFTDPWVLFVFYIVKNWNICFYLNFSSYLSASQPQIVTQGSGELQQRVVGTSYVCTCSSEGNGVCIFLRQSRAFVSKTTFTDVCVGQFSMVLACVVRADCLSVNTSAPCELCCFKSLARGFISRTDVSTEQDGWFYFFFCFNAWVSSWWYVTLLSVCLSDWRKLWGSNVLSDVFQ